MKARLRYVYSVPGVPDAPPRMEEVGKSIIDWYCFYFYKQGIIYIREDLLFMENLFRLVFNKGSVNLNTKGKESLYIFKDRPN